MMKKSQKTFNGRKHLSQNEISITKTSTTKNVRVDFNLKESNQAQISIKNMRPVFNKDKLFYTPAFENDDDKIQSDFDRKVHQYLHNDKIKTQIEQIDEEQIQVARPSERNSYCTICKERFEDYREHLQVQEHQKKMNGSEFNKDIADLCIFIQAENKGRVARIKEEEDEILAFEKKSKKKVKRSQKTEDLYQQLFGQTFRYVQKSLRPREMTLQMSVSRFLQVSL